MKKFLFLLIAVLFTAKIQAQDAKSLFDDALKKVQEAKLDEGIKLLDQSIALQPNQYPAYQIRGTAKALQRRYEEALLDFNQALKLNPKAKKAYLNRAIAKKKLTDYEGAILDLSNAITIDANMGEAFFNRALIYEMLGQTDKACADFKSALKLNLPMAAVKAEMCDNPLPNAPKTYSILKLLPNTDPKYGLSKDNCIKVGTSPNGATENEINYFELLRDAQNKPVAYRKTASCCAYQTPNGQASINTYELSYKDITGKEKKMNVYITAGQYQEPKVMAGLRTLGQKWNYYLPPKA